MNRCFLPADRWGQPEAELSAEESHHLAGVLRAQAGQRIGLLDGAGRTGEAEVVAPHKKHTRIRILSRQQAPANVPRRILAQALVREQQMDWLIQKAVELGVHEIWPLQTDHAVVKVRAEDGGKKVARWQSVALAACKQSGNPWLPTIRPVQKLAGALAGLPPAPAAACFGALQSGAMPLPAYLTGLRQAVCSTITMFIGPEGDFSQAEVAAMLAAGVQPVTFGPLIFRVGTAALFILSAVHYAWMK